MADKVDVKVEGMSELLVQLAALGVSAEDAIEKAMKPAIQEVWREAVLMCPVDEGDLRNSINTTVEKEGNIIVGTVRTNSDHAAYVEFGTGQRGMESSSPPKAPLEAGYRVDWPGMAAQPYLFPASEIGKITVPKRLVKNLKGQIRKAVKGSG